MKNNKNITNKKSNKKSNKNELKNKSSKYGIYVICELIFAILFSIFSINFHFDISLLAFPIAVIFTGITVYYGYFNTLSKKDGKNLFVFSKLIQYIPFVMFLAFVVRRTGNFGTSYWYDVVCVFLWCGVFIFSLIISRCLHPKRIDSYTYDWNVKPVIKNKPVGVKRVIFEIVDWADALLQAVFMVLLIQIFVLQLYVIPSESMVPKLLIGDRVAVSKINCGPKFPLTEVGVPDFGKYNRGDVVVLRNPHYSMDRKSEVKTVTSQLVYMLTFMQVNLNKDENGELKYDPLVKRICGEEGEQLVMQDGVLYSRTKDNPVFTPVELDSQFACWNLNELSPSIKSKVREFTLTQNHYDQILEFEEYRRNFDLDVAEFIVNELVEKLNKLVSVDNSLPKYSHLKNNYQYMFSDFKQITTRLIKCPGGVEWFSDFMTSWIPSKDDIRDVYSESNYKINVISKICFGNLVVRYAQLINQSASIDSYVNDVLLKEYMDEAEKIHFYLTISDLRNMPVFPPNDVNGNPQFIPEDCYFMMGDNRFNSLDLRHGKNYRTLALSQTDPMSVEYEALINPEYINKKYIIGKPVFTFWPLNRMGAVN